MSEPEPDQIDMMEEHELRAELRSVLLRLDEVLADRSTAREHLQRERDRADEAEARLSRLQTALQRIVDGRFLGYAEAQVIARGALDRDIAVERQK